MNRPDTITETDYISDDKLTKLEELAAAVPQDFEMASSQVYPKTVVATIKFATADDVLERAGDLPRLFEAAMWIDALCKNLRAERAALTRFTFPDKIWEELDSSVQETMLDDNWPVLYTRKEGA